MLRCNLRLGTQSPQGESSRFCRVLRRSVEFTANTGHEGDSRLMSDLCRDRK